MVSAEDDEDALRWAGEDLASRPAERPRARTRRGAEAASTEGEPSRVESDREPPTAGPSSLTLVSIGVLGGIAFLSTLGWISFALRSMTRSTVDPLASGMFNLGLWLSILAAPLWFALSFWLVRRPGIRFLVLAIGAVALIPVPLVWPR